MAADMWRIPASVVKKGSLMSFIQDRGVLRHAVTASSNNMYLFSEVGAGVQPLALIGYHHEVLQFLVDRPASGIDNRIGELPAIYMGICFYRPGQRFVGLFPVHDALTEVTKGVVGVGSGGIGNVVGTGGIGSTVMEIGGGVSDGVGLWQGLFGKKKSKQPTLSSTHLYVKFSYLQEKGMEKVGSGTVTFKTLYPVVDKAIKSM